MVFFSSIGEFSVSFQSHIGSVCDGNSNMSKSVHHFVSMLVKCFVSRYCFVSKLGLFVVVVVVVVVILFVVVVVVVVVLFVHQLLGFHCM